VRLNLSLYFPLIRTLLVLLSSSLSPSHSPPPPATVMYEDVCLQCGKPLTDGYISRAIPSPHPNPLLPIPDRRAYCGYDCESLDATSPSISTSSSNSPSPHIGFTMAPTPDREIPALLPIALGGGGPLQNYSRYQNISNHSTAIPRYSALSHWSSGHYMEDENDHPDHNAFFDSNEKLFPSSGLNYARRPSSTNWHSTIPHPRLARASESGASSPVRSCVGAPRSVPTLPLLPPTSPSSGADDELSDGTNDKESSLRPDQSSTKKTTCRAAKPSASKKRNRASLPGYFSLLALTTSPGIQSSQRPPSSSGVNRSRNIPRSASHMMTAPSTSAITPTTVHANQSDSPSSAFEEASARGRAERGRSRHRGPGSSTSPGVRNDSRKRSPPRLRTVVSTSRSPATAVVPASPNPPTSRRRQRGRRVDSHEKVSDWVSTSVNPESRLRSRSRRYSNESDEGEDRNWRLRDAGTHNLGIGGERRGRRRVHELDAAPADVDGPGFGGGRSGLRDRERRGVVAQGLSP